jgi:acetyl-CoA acetyltransferase/uncharacterized OB-fold protein
MTSLREASSSEPDWVEAAGRALPEPGWFWRSGADGVLRVGQCCSCGRLLHPSRERCPGCGGDDIDTVALSGEAVIASYTVNHQRWWPDLATPYVIAVVALAEDPRVRLTTNIIGCEPDAVVVGMRVRVEFRAAHDVWLPLFTPCEGEAAPAHPTSESAEIPNSEPPPAVAPRSPAARRFEHRVVISGIGRSQVGRWLDEPRAELTLSACRAAIADAGLNPSDIDGVCAYPGPVAGHADISANPVARRLGLTTNWTLGAHEVPGQTGGVIAAMIAVASGFCRHVLCWTAVSTQVRPGLHAGPRSGRVTGEPQWQAPFGAISPANWVALAASRYFARYGDSQTRRDALAWVAIAARRHAALNPDALYREPLELAEYRAGRPISTPLRIFDCDVPCDGAFAVVVSAKETAADLAGPSVRVDAVGAQLAEEQSWDQGMLTHQQNLFGPAREMWSRASVSRDDVDLANLYDGFSFNVLCWLEALGFCGLGEAADFVASGTRIGLTGQLPVNPHGGQLSAGRGNGFGHLLEAVEQLRGRAGQRQVPSAEVAVVSCGGGIPANCMILTADR